MTKKVIVDTNVLLRVILDEPSDNFVKAKKIIDGIERGRLLAIVSELVIAECIWVLMSVYKKTKSEILPIITELILRDNFEIRDKDVIAQSMEVFEQHNISWIDSYLYCLSKNTNTELITFDVKLNKLCK